MTISFECPHCNRGLKAKETLTGKRVRCPQCQQPVQVPAPASSPEEPLDDWLRDPDQPAPSATDAASGREDETDSAADSNSSAEEFPDLSEFLPRRKQTETDDEGLPALPAVRSRRKSTATGEGGFVRPIGAGQEERPVRTRSAPAPEPVATVEKTHHVWGAGPHWFVLLLFIPLVLHIIWPGKSIDERMQEHPEIIEQLNELQGIGDLDDLCAQLPGDRIPGAHLARQSSIHWVYAGSALFSYWGLLCFFLRNSSASPGRLFWTIILTGTVGIILLLMFQTLALSMSGMRVRGRGIIGLILLLIKFIGYSYVCALDPDSSLLGSMMGFTCGVGFCEELCKALPIIIYLRNAEKSNWQGAFLMGLASGIGFGVSEGVEYSASHYNGVATGGIYFVRFMSCVALHAVWASGVALLMYANQEFIEEFFSWEGFAMFVIYDLLVAMLLHGLYDTLLKKDYDIAALLTAFVSFGWWLWVLSRVGKPIKRRRAETA